jgi:hypothetical protein
MFKTIGNLIISSGKNKYYLEQLKIVGNIFTGSTDSRLRV